MFKCDCIVLLKAVWERERSRTKRLMSTGDIVYQLPKLTIIPTLSSILYELKISTNVFTKHPQNYLPIFYLFSIIGSLCPKFLTHRYQIPVMDTIFIRKDHRGHGHGLHMLEDFIVSYRQEIMGLSCPLSPAMYKGIAIVQTISSWSLPVTFYYFSFMCPSEFLVIVCKKYLSLHPDDTELLWEILDVGSPFQRTQISRKLQAMDLKGKEVLNL